MKASNRTAINDNSRPAKRARARLAKLLGETVRTAPAPLKAAEG